MTRQSQSYNIRAIQELLITGFNVEQLRSLFSLSPAIPQLRMNGVHQ